MFRQFLSTVTGNLIIINVLVFFASNIILGEPVIDQTGRNFESLGRLYLAAFMPGSPHFEPFQLATHMFMHDSRSLQHLFFNMFSLGMFGLMVERVWGPKQFLFYYLCCGIGSYAMHMGVQYWEITQAGIPVEQWNSPMLGASGAVFGILTAYGCLFPNRTIMLMLPPIELKAKYYVLIIAGLELFYGVSRYSSGIAHYAHLGGALVGFIMIMYWYRGRFPRY